MTQITFLELDAEDRTSVQKQFPEATLVQGAIQGDELVAACKSAEIVSCFIHSPFDRDVLGRLPTLKLLCTRSVGYDHIDLAACAELGISVCWFEKPFEDSVKTLTDMMTTKVSSSDYNDKMGFTGGMK